MLEPLPLILAHYLSVTLDNEVGSSGLLHSAILNYCVLAVMPFFIVACDGAIGHPWTYSSLQLSSLGVLVPLPM